MMMRRRRFSTSPRQAPFSLSLARCLARALLVAPCGRDRRPKSHANFGTVCAPHRDIATSSIL